MSEKIIEYPVFENEEQEESFDWDAFYAERDAQLFRLFDSALAFQEKVPLRYDMDNGVWLYKGDVKVRGKDGNIKEEVEVRDSQTLYWLLDEYCVSSLIYHFYSPSCKYLGFADHAHSFDEVLRAVLKDPLEFFIPKQNAGEYSNQQIKLIEKFREKICLDIGESPKNDIISDIDFEAMEKIEVVSISSAEMDAMIEEEWQEFCEENPVFRLTD